MNPAIRRSRAGLIAALALCAHAEAAASPQAPAAVRSVQIDTAANGGTSVSVQADGALPPPVVGVLDNPPRLYLDFNGITLGPGVAAEGISSGIRGVRLSRHRLRPPVVRVVVDLLSPGPHRIDATARADGRVVVLLAGAASPVAPSALAAPRAPAASVPQGGSPASAPAGPVRSPDADRYVAQVSALLARLHRARATVATLAGAGGLTSAELQTLAAELDENAQLLRAVKAPASIATPHDLLMRFCALGGRAVRLRLDAGASADSGAVQNAASAAAGALIVLDRASRELAYAPPR